MNKQKSKTKKLTIDFPADEFVYLKMACEKQGVSIKDFVIRSVIKSVEDYEDNLGKLSIEMALKEAEETGFISYDEMKKLVG